MTNQPREEDFLQSMSRRSIFASLPMLLLLGPRASHARGLVRFPCDKPLLNIYHLMHAGTSLLEEEDIWSTNPLFLTNREDCLSPKGREEVTAASEILRTSRPTLIKYSLAASAMDSADIVSQVLGIGRDRLVPEFTFMDPRAIGMWDMLSMKETEPAVWAMDNDQAGPGGTGGRPPANDDGTAHETLADQAVRLRQLMSILESQFSGETILLCFPDGTSPALLSAMIAGIPYNRVHELEFKNGEVRLDVTMKSTLVLWQQKQNNAEYDKYLAKGRERLPVLLTRKEVVNKKDQKLEAERIAIELQQAEQDRMRQELQKQEDNKRQRRLQAVSAESSTDGNSPIIYGSVLAGVASIAVLGFQSERNQSLSTSMDSISPATNVSSESNTNSTTSSSPIELPEDINFAESFKELQGDSKTPPTSNNSMDPTTILSNKTDTDELSRRKATASVAMQNYLDEDDGGDAWLASMKDIIKEDEVPPTDDDGDNIKDWQ